MNKPVIVSAITITAFLPALANAEYFGLPNAGLLQTLPQSQITLEAGYSNGDLDDADYSHVGLRAGIQMLDNLLVFADLGSSSLSNNDEVSVGFGGVYSLDNALPIGESTAVKASLHRFEYSSLCTTLGFNGATAFGVTGNIDSISALDGLSVGARSCGADITTISVELLTRGAPITSMQIANSVPVWFANIGVHSFGDSDIDTTVGIGGGLAYNTDSGTTYLALENNSDFVLSFGYQHKLR